MASGNEPVSWGKDAVVQWASAPGLVGEVLDTEPVWEQAPSTFLVHAAGRHTPVALSQEHLLRVGLPGSVLSTCSHKDTEPLEPSHPLSAIVVESCVKVA